MVDQIDVTKLSWSSLVKLADKRLSKFEELSEASVPDTTATKKAEAAFLAADAEISKRETANKTSNEANVSKSESKSADNEE